MVCTFFSETQGILPREERPLSGECRQHLRVFATFAPLLTPGGLSSGIRAQEAAQSCPPRFPEGDHGDGPALTEPNRGSGASEEWEMSNECVLSNWAEGEAVARMPVTNLKYRRHWLFTYLFSPRQPRVERGARRENGGWLSVSRSCPFVIGVGLMRPLKGRCAGFGLGGRQNPGICVRTLCCLEPHLS